MQLGIGLSPLWYYLLLFAVTVIYYTHAYIGVSTADPNNVRSYWYLQHKNWMIKSQIVLSLLLLISTFFTIQRIWSHLHLLKYQDWFVLFLFPATALFYYGIETFHFKSYNLRNNGWMKPFVIGFVWGGSVSVYPVFYHYLEVNQPYIYSVFQLLLFVKNFMFITVLCIMFDIKDYAYDYNQQLKTFVVRVGLRNTIFYIMLPLCIIGLGTFLIYTIGHHFPLGWILFNSIPFILLIMVAWSMYQRKSILYYLAIIDGLMLLKALCGITGTLFLK